MPTVEADLIDIAEFGQLALPDHYELVFGRVVEKPPMSVGASELQNQVNNHLFLFLTQHDLGRVFVEMLHRIPLADDGERNRRPDVSFVSYAKWPKNKRLPKPDAAWDVVPDLAVEVVSPTDKAEEALAKIREYFRAGVKLVWVFYPELEIAQVFESASACRFLTRNEELDGGTVLPGFRLPLSSLFPEA